ncbi:MAG: 2,3-bisphosphoglycerate-independent phosphoglycerate mutase, partial [Patescibacteria group bacterium]
KKFSHFPVEKFSNLFFVTMAEYNKELKVDVAFPEESIEKPLGLVLSEAGLKQLRIAEGEKYAHVTHFFDGGSDTVFPGEERVKVDSVNTKDFSDHPKMSAKDISDRVVQEIEKGKFDVIIMNYANPDMVGHTGNYEATVQALEFLDPQIGRVVDAALAAGGAVLLTCDHGKAETITSTLTGKRTTDHTNNPVPLIYVAPHVKLPAPKDEAVVVQILSNPIGVLADVAPTTLEILGLSAPPQMTAQSLLGSLT